MQIGYSPGPRVAQGMDLRLFAVIVCVVATRLVAYLIFPVYDDAFITFRYSANLADGFGFVYHPGESVLGTTAPGFGLIVAGLMALGADPEVLVPFVNIVLDVAIVILTARLLMDSAGDFAALGFGLIYAAMPLAGRITVGGMEANTFLLTCIAATWLYGTRRESIAAAVAAVAFFLRPEAVVMVGALCLAELFNTGFLRAVRLGLIALATVVPGLIVQYWLYGNIVPQSVVAKSISGGSMLEVVRELILPDPIAALLVVLAPVGFYLCIRQRRGSMPVLAAFVVLYAAAYLLRAPKPWSWYALPIQFGISLFAAMALAHLLKYVPKPSPRMVTRICLGLCLAVMTKWALIGWRLGPDDITRNIYRPLAAWCSDRVAPAATFMAGDIGILGFRCRNRIYDTAGLVWPEMFSLRSQESLIRKYRPDYLFVNANAVATNSIASAEVMASYVPVARFARSGEQDLSIAPGRVPRDWVQDYLLFQRRD